VPCDYPLQFASAMTTVKVSVEAKKKLKEWKKRFGAKSIDALLQSMDPEEMDRQASASASADEDEDVGEPVKRRKIDVREPLYSLDILAERPGMLEYYTGFDRSEVDLLIRRFSEVSLGLVFFHFWCSAAKRAVVMVRAWCSYLLLIGHRIRGS
jgi:hypothetical protein